jgi:hypothetical protein
MDYEFYYAGSVLWNRGPRHPDVSPRAIRERLARALLEELQPISSSRKR